MHQQTRQIIRKLMSDQGIPSERRLAIECGMSQSTLQRFMAEKTDSLDFNHLMAIAHRFEITVSQLIGETPMEQDPKIRQVVVAMEAMPDYMKNVVLATTQTLASQPPGPSDSNKKAA